MDEIKDLKNFLKINEINKKILTECQNELRTSVNLLYLTEEQIINQINELSCRNDEFKVIQKVILLLFVQTVKSFKGSLILSLNGYYTNSMMIVRNIIENIFNVAYLFENSKDSYIKAVKYLKNDSRWANENIKNRAYFSFNSTLYNLYRNMSNYTHSNYPATIKNTDDMGNLTLYPSNKEIKDFLSTANSVYYCFIELVCEQFEIELNDNIFKTKDFIDKYKTYKMFNFSKKNHSNE